MDNLNTFVIKSSILFGSIAASCMALVLMFNATGMLGDYSASSAAAVATADSHAQLTDAQMQALVTLLSAFGVDQNTISNVESVLSGNSTSNSGVTRGAPGPVNAPNVPTGPTAFGNVGTTTSHDDRGDHQEFCFAPDHNLAPRSTDDQTDGEVSKLQQFLGVEPSGFFGSTTQAAVQQWQMMRGIIASGSPETTGFGGVGPKTRDDIKVNCGLHRGMGSSTPPFGAPKPPTPEGDQ